MKYVLWTGGWDSTFRVADAVINKKADVQPYYVLDEDRGSWEMELETMNKLTSMLNDLNNKGESGRVLDFKTVNKKDIIPNEDITTSYKNLASQAHL